MEEIVRCMGLFRCVGSTPTTAARARGGAREAPDHTHHSRGDTAPCGHRSANHGPFGPFLLRLDARRPPPVPFRVLFRTPDTTAHTDCLP